MNSDEDLHEAQSGTPVPGVSVESRQAEQELGVVRMSEPRVLEYRDGISIAPGTVQRHCVDIGEMRLCRCEQRGALELGNLYDLSRESAACELLTLRHDAIIALPISKQRRNGG